MYLRYRYRIYPNKLQQELIKRTFGCCRFVYNRFLSERIEYYTETGRNKTYAEQHKELVVLKKSCAWLCDVDSQALVSSLRDLDSAFRNYFSTCDSSHHYGYPKYKRKKDGVGSYRTYVTNLSSPNICVGSNFIKLPKLGRVKCAVSRDAAGRITSATVSMSPSGKYFVSVCVEVDSLGELPKTDKSVGVDLGLKNIIVTSDGIRVEGGQFLRKSLKKIIRLQQELSRKQRGSSNWCKTRRKLAKIHEYIANQRKDMLHKLSAYLVEHYDVIVIETLCPENLMQNHKLALSIIDAGWAELCKQLEYKATVYGRTLIRVDRFYPSSQLCSVCGAKNSDVKDLSIRRWTCPECGSVLDRDINAAINILHEGIKQLSIA